MNVLKSLLLAMLLVALLVYTVGAGVFDVSNIQVMINNQHLEPLTTVILSALAAMVIIIAGLAFILSFIGGLLFVTLVICCSIFLWLLGVFWPIVLVAFVIWLCSSKKTFHYN
jgi:uncharacterized membrane protein (UPF0182 family)